MNKEWLQAYENIQKFIEDCEIELHISKADFISDKNKNYTFILESDDIGNYTVKITMPSFPLNIIRYTGEKGQDQWNYKRILVNDSSWIWKYALITKKNIINNLEEKIDMLEEKIDYYKDCIENLKGDD